MPDEALRLLKEAERSANDIARRFNGDRMDAARMIAELYAALGDRDSAVAQTKRVTQKRDEPRVLAGVAVGLAQAGGLEDAFEVVIHLESPIETDRALWEIASISARIGKPEIAMTAILEFVAPQKPPLSAPKENRPRPELLRLPRQFHSESDGDFDQVLFSGLCAVCKSLSRSGKPNDAMSFLTAIEPTTYLSPEKRAIAIVNIAEGIVAAEREQQKQKW
jgi:hypothetical protein